jgi:GDP-L-fucose synthase
MRKNNMKIYVAGHRGLIGSAIVRRLIAGGVSEEDIITKTHNELDLTNQYAVKDFFAKHKIDQVYVAAVKVGGIVGNNNHPGEFIYKNLMIQNNVIHNAYEHGVQKLLFLGSTCVLPKLAENPIKEESLLTGKLESTNEPYAIAKIAGIKMCESYNRQYGTDYRSILQCNLYGPGDNYDEENGHLAAGVIRRFLRAKLYGDKQFVVWGTGKPRREFVYVDDMAEAAIQVMNVDKTIWDSVTEPMQNFVNVGAGRDIEISEFVEIAKKALDFDGEIVYDTNKPDGTMNKLTDNSRITKLGWTPKTDLSDGLKKAYEWYVTNIANKSTTI